MAKSINSAPRAGYTALLEWRIANGLPDAWYISVAGNTANELYTLDQIRTMHANSPSSIIQVLNSSQSQDPNAEWVVFREIDRERSKADKSAKETAGCGYTAAVLLPIVGFFIGLFMISNDKTRPKAGGVILVSIVMTFVWWVVFSSFGF